MVRFDTVLASLSGVLDVDEATGRADVRHER
jgi:hypothetical protein